MNRIIFALTLLIISLSTAVGATLFILNNTTSPQPNTTNALPNMVAEILPVTVSITGTVTEGSVTTTRTGTGIIVDASGIILTNKHLVSEGFTYSVELHDGTIVSAKLLKVHSSRDLALLSLISDQPLSLSVGVFINSQANVRQGDSVMAIGNMLGLYPGSVSEGIVSGLDRTVSFSGIAMNGLLQTSIPMSLGNSGGPLLNLEGKIIGINTGIVGGSSQIGWALPLTQEEVDEFLK